MGTGSRHSKNAGTMGSENLTYAEKKALGFGTIKERLGKETVKDFDHCGLGLTHAVDPMVTPEGVLYDREHILQCLLHQKKDIARKMKTWEAEQARDADKATAEEDAKRLAELEKFELENTGGVGNYKPSAATGTATPGTETHVSSSADVAATLEEKNRMKTMKAFWLPSKTPTAEIKAEKPDTDTKCPTTLKKLRLKDLLSVKWTRVRKGEETGGSRYMCPVTFKTYTNSTKIVVLKPSGHAVSEEAWLKVVKGEGNYDGHRVKGVIKLQRGGSGFAGSGTQVESKTEFMLGAGSGLADGRGQNRGATSKFGLRFN